MPATIEILDDLIKALAEAGYEITASTDDYNGPELFTSSGETIYRFSTNDDDIAIALWQSNGSNNFVLLSDGLDPLEYGRLGMAELLAILAEFEILTIH